MGIAKYSMTTLSIQHSSQRLYLEVHHSLLPNWMKVAKRPEFKGQSFYRREREQRRTDEYDQKQAV
jgi:hypothetical protein